MKFYPMPQFPGPSETLAEFAAVVRIPKNFGLFAAPVVTSAGVMPAEGVGLKPYRNNAAVYTFASSFTHLVQRGAIALSQRSRIGDAGTPVVDVEGITELEGTYSREAIAFYNRRVLAGDKSFLRVPRLIWVTQERNEASRLNIVFPPGQPPVAVEWPLAIATNDAQIPTSFNNEVALRFHPTSGTVEAFFFADYDREFPIVTGSLADAEFLGAVEGILESPMGPSEKATAIRLLARR